MAHGRNEEDEAPENPADPVEDARNEKRDGQNQGHGTMYARRDGVKDVSAVELGGRDEVERGNEQADPACDENRMVRGVRKGRNAGLDVREKAVHQGDGQGIGKIYAGVGAGGVGASRCWMREQQADGDGDDRGDVAGDWAVGSHVHESVAVGNAAADLDYGTSGPAERRRGQNPGEGGANSVDAARDVVAEFMRQKNR